MLDEREQNALLQIKLYLEAGHSLDEIRQNGWRTWIDRLEAKGYSLRTGRLAVRPPEEPLRDAAQPLPDVSAASVASAVLCARCGSYRNGSRPYCGKCGTKFPDGAPAAAAVREVPVGSAPLCEKCGSYRVGRRPYCKKCGTQWPDGAPPGVANKGPFELMFMPIRAWWSWSGQRQTTWGKVLAFVGPPLILIVLIVAASFSSDGDQSAGGGASSYSVLEQSAVAFEGGYSEAEIKRVLDRAMNLYGLSITESNYDRTTNTLVALRLEYGIREMDILDYMIRSYVPGVNITFAEMAGLATVGLLAGDY